MRPSTPVALAQREEKERERREISVHGAHRLFHEIFLDEANLSEEK